MPSEYVITPEEVYELQSGNITPATESKIKGVITKAIGKVLTQFDSRDIAYEHLSADETNKLIGEVLPLFAESYMYRDLSIDISLVMPYAVGAIMAGKKKLGAEFTGAWGTKGMVARPLEPKLFGKTSWKLTISSADTWTDFIGTSSSTYTFDTKENGFGSAVIAGFVAYSDYVPQYIHAYQWKSTTNKWLLYTGHQREGDFKILKVPRLELADALFVEKDELYIRVKDPDETGTVVLHPVGIVTATVDWIKSKVGWT